MHLPKPELQRRKQCKGCGMAFNAKRPDAKFCTQACRQKSNRNKKVIKRKARLPRTGFIKWLVYECKRAGTVEILQGTDLKQLQALRKRCNRFSGFRDGKVNPRVYEISHVAPVRHSTIVGCLHPANLVIAPFCINRGRGTHWVNGSGVYLQRSCLQNKWKVFEADSFEHILKLIMDYLGAEVVDAFLADTDLALTFHESQIDYLLGQGFSEFRLRKMTSAEVSELADDYGFEASTFSCAPMLEFDAIPLEAERLAGLGVSRVAPLATLENTLDPYGLEDLWAMLHGGDAPANLPELLHVARVWHLRQRLHNSTKPVRGVCIPPRRRVYEQLADPVPAPAPSLLLAWPSQYADDETIPF